MKDRKLLAEIEGNVMINRAYVQRKIPVESLQSLIDAHFPNMADIIDYLWLDIEGPEYALMPRFATGGSMNREDSRTICQINVELHGPLEHYKMNAEKFRNLTLQMVSETDFVPFSWVFVGHHRVALFNWRSRECVRKFIDETC